MRMLSLPIIPHSKGHQLQNVIESLAATNKTKITRNRRTIKISFIIKRFLTIEFNLLMWVLIFKLTIRPTVEKRKA